MSSTTNEKRFVEYDKVVIVWKVRWVVKKKNSFEIKEMSFENKNDAYNLMYLHLKRKKCSWVERHEKKIKCRDYEVLST